jgi:fatty-acid peroxygenase
VRRGTQAVPESSAVARIAWHRDERGWVMTSHDAAVELLNVLRPTVAVAVYMVFVALALERQDRAGWRRHLLESEASCFIQEVRRFYPFFPAVAARVRRGFTWRGCRFPQGRRVLLDLYGINHDPRLWRNPATFAPERFRLRREDAYDLVPQGGGPVAEGHRCPGEGIALALMTEMLHFLTSRIEYEVTPGQDLELEMRRLPPLPRGGLVLSNVRYA